MKYRMTRPESPARLAMVRGSARGITAEYARGYVRLRERCAREAMALLAKDCEVVARVGQGGRDGGAVVGLDGAGNTVRGRRERALGVLEEYFERAGGGAHRKQ